MDAQRGKIPNPELSLTVLSVGLPLSVCWPSQPSLVWLLGKQARAHTSVVRTGEYNELVVH